MGKKLPEGYKEFLDEFAIVVSSTSNKETTSGAVHTQISNAKCIRAEVVDNPYYYIVNTAAALNAGFLERKDLPKSLLMERG